LLDEAERLYMSDFSPNVRPIAALKTRVWLAQGRVGEALDWMREQGLSPQDELSYGREFEHITLAKLLLARATSERANHFMGEAIQLLDRLLEAAETGERMGSVIEILVVQALAHQMNGDIPAALASLSRALRLAEPEGYVRTFVDEGQAMAHLLPAAAAQGMMPGYVEMLLAAFPEPDKETRRPGDKEIDRAAVSPVSRSPGLPTSWPLVEPLSARELDVLRLLRTDLSGPEIARELRVSLNTLRTHTNNIYTKLGVNNRRAAIRRAQSLDMF
jgi:LuxR family maltose regulon positive regulatory protein